MGKKAKEHRAKVAKRNQRVSQEKSKMQKAFDKIFADQLEKIKQNDGLEVKVGDTPVTFNVVDPNETQTGDQASV
jgi:hypothetical protein